MSPRLEGSVKKSALLHLQPVRGGERLAWPPEIQLKTKGGVFLPWTPARFSANEVVLPGCLTRSLSEKGALSLPFVNHTIAVLFCALSTLDGIFSFLCLVLFQP